MNFYVMRAAVGERMMSGVRNTTNMLSLRKQPHFNVQRARGEVIISLKNPKHEALFVAILNLHKVKYTVVDDNRKRREK